jgi:hypothetical protein
VGEGSGVVERCIPLVHAVVEREFFFDVGEGREHGLADVGESGGFAERDAVLRGGDEKFAEDMVDIGGGEEIAVERCGNFGAETLGLEELELLVGVESAEERMKRVARHAAAAAVGELELAAGGDGGAGGCVGHGSLFEVDLWCEMRESKCEIRRLSEWLRTSEKSRCFPTRSESRSLRSE